MTSAGRWFEELHEIGAMHAEGGVPPGGIRHLHGRDLGAVGAEVARVAADASAEPRHLAAEADALELPDAVGCDEDARADLPQRRRLFEDIDAHSDGQKRVGGEEAADPAADNGDMQRFLRHRTFLPEPPSHGRVAFHR